MAANRCDWGIAEKAKNTCRQADMRKSSILCFMLARDKGWLCLLHAQCYRNSLDSSRICHDTLMLRHVLVPDTCTSLYALTHLCVHVRAILQLQMLPGLLRHLAHQDLLPAILFHFSIHGMGLYLETIVNHLEEQEVCLHASH